VSAKNGKSPSAATIAGARVAVRAPAKLNLFLHVGDKRPDGYHALQSLVAFADMSDVLEIAPASELSLTITGPFAAQVPRGTTNLVLRAARALAERCAHAPLGASMNSTSGYAFASEPTSPVDADRATISWALICSHWPRNDPRQASSRAGARHDATTTEIVGVAPRRGARRRCVELGFPGGGLADGMDTVMRWPGGRVAAIAPARPRTRQRPTLPPARESPEARSQTGAGVTALAAHAAPSVA